MNVTIIGCGFVGLVTGACLAEVGHRVHGIEHNPARLAKIQTGAAPFYEPDLDPLLAREMAAGRLSVGDNVAQVAEAELVFLCVGTPTVEGKIDLRQVLAAADAVAPHLAIGGDRFPVVVVKSTVLPGTTNEPVRAALEATSGKVAHRDFGLAMNPEFLREGSAVLDFREPDRILLGSDSRRALDTLQALYRPFAGVPVVELTASNAELAKYANNALLATLVSFMNDLASLAETIPGTDIEAVADAMALDKRLSPVVGGTRVRPGILTYMRAGIGYGGSCLPKDVAALSRLAAAQGRSSAMLEAVQAANEARPLALVRAVAARLGTLNGRKVALLGLAFKPRTDDTREAVAFRLAAAFAEAGTTVVGWDPMVRDLPAETADHLALADDIDDALRDADAAVIVTAWPEFAAYDWSRGQDLMRTPYLVDGRNQLRGHALPPNLIYHPIGVRAPDQASDRAPKRMADVPRTATGRDAG